MPSRDDGFAIMDVSTSICDDPKFRRLARENPELVAPAFTAYVATMAESWRVGRRVPVEDAWPGFLVFDQAVCDALRRVALVDQRGLVSSKAWRGWFAPARERRAKSRERWARYNAKRDADTTPPPRGSDVGTATSVRSFRPSVPSEPSAPSTRATRGERHGLKALTGEDAIKALDAEYAAGRIDGPEYRRRRESIA